jgi:formamidopyrimidine-DNA glycosylase
MPELPEVEVTRLSFADRIAGGRIECGAHGQAAALAAGHRDPELLAGRTVHGCAPTGKIPAAGSGPGAVTGASGHVGQPAPLGASCIRIPVPHDHCDVHTSRGVLRLNDPRRFGAVVMQQARNAPAVKSCWANWAEPLEAAFDLALSCHLQCRNGYRSSRYCWLAMPWWAWAIYTRQRLCFVPVFGPLLKAINHQPASR